MKKDLLTGKSGKIGLIIKALLLFAAVFAAAVMLSQISSGGSSRRTSVSPKRLYYI